MANNQNINKKDKMQIAPTLERNENLGISIARLIPAIIFSAIVILIVRTQTYSLPMSQFFWSEHTDDSVLSDSFSMFKMKTIVFSAILAILWLLYTYSIGEFRFRKYSFYPFIGVYTLFVLLSFFFSDYKSIAWRGAEDRFEGTLTILCYMVLFIFIANVVQNERDLKILIYPIFISLLLLGLLGVSQATNHDFFRTCLGQKLITPKVPQGDGTTSWDVIDKIFADGGSAYDFTMGNLIYETVFNPNYVPFYICLVLPLFAFLFIHAFDKNASSKGKVLMATCGFLLLPLSLYCFLASGSSGGFFGLAMMAILFIILFRKKIKEWLYPLFALILVIASVFGFCRVFWVDEVKRFFAEAPSIFPIAYADEEPAAVPSYPNPPSCAYAPIDRILTGDNWVSMSINRNNLAAVLDSTGLTFYDSDSQMIAIYPIDDGSNYYMFGDDRFHDFIKVGYQFQNKGKDFYLVYNTAGTEWVFHYTNAGFLYLTPVSTKEHPREIAIKEIPTWGFEGKSDFGSGRGYIWSRSIPMLKSRIFIGSGADTFCYVFPQNDYAGKYSLQHNILMITDKPHCLYLQLGINTGCISLLAFLGLLVCFAIDCIKHSCKMKGLKPLAEYVGSAAFLGVFGFAATALVDDGSVSTMPLFYSMMAIGFACNRMVEAKEA